jgi:mRNA-degrading endonuclease RelE of RelBE toxin-antitoxin system
MKYEIVLSPEAIEDLESLSANERSKVQDALETHLRHEPINVSRSRIKRLQGLSQPQYRLRVGDIRVFYDVTEASVQVLAIVKKSEALAWLESRGKPDEGSSAV